MNKFTTIYNGDYPQIVDGVYYRITVSKRASYAEVTKPPKMVRSLSKQVQSQVYQYQKGLKVELSKLKHKLKLIEKD